MGAFALQPQIGSRHCERAQGQHNLRYLLSGAFQKLFGLRNG